MYVAVTGRVLNVGCDVITVEGEAVVYGIYALLCLRMVPWSLFRRRIWSVPNVRHGEVAPCLFFFNGL